MSKRHGGKEKFETTAGAGTGDKTVIEGDGKVTGPEVTVEIPTDLSAANPANIEASSLSFPTSQRRRENRFTAMLEALRDGNGDLKERAKAALAINILPEYRVRTFIALAGTGSSIVALGVLAVLGRGSADVPANVNLGNNNLRTNEITTQNVVPTMTLEDGTVVNIQTSPTGEVSVQVVPTNIPEGSSQYVVQAGENFFRIALNHGMTVDALAQYNASVGNPIANPEMIMIGQVIFFPAGTPIVEQQSAVVYSADVAAGGGNTNPELCSDPNQAGREVRPGAYCIKQGDSLWSVSQSLGMTVDQLAALNGITDINDPTQFKLGTVLRTS